MIDLRIRSHFLATVLLVSAVVVALPLVASAQDIANPANPYDWVGAVHNQGLDYAIEAAVGLNDDPVGMLITMEAAAYDFAESMANGNSFCASDLTGPVAELIAAKTEAEKWEIVSRDLSPAQASVLSEIFVIVDQYAPDTDVFRQHMVALEGQIMLQLSRRDAKPLLASAAVARYSHAYWIEQVTLGDQSPWQVSGVAPKDLLDPDNPSALGIWDIVEGDIRGAALGSPGGAQGAAAGAVITSGIGILGAIWNWLF